MTFSSFTKSFPPRGNSELLSDSVTCHFVKSQLWSDLSRLWWPSNDLRIPVIKLRWWALSTEQFSCSSQAIKITFRPSLGLDMKLSSSFSFSLLLLALLWVRPEYRGPSRERLQARSLWWSAVIFLCWRLNSLKSFCCCRRHSPVLKRHKDAVRADPDPI